MPSHEPAVSATSRAGLRSARPRSGFARAEDGVALHYNIVGQGPVIACCNGVGVGTFFWKYLAEHFRDRFTIVMWDYRGHGRSRRGLDPATADLSIRRHADDLAHVLEQGLPGCGPAILIGHSMGCQVALETRRRHPHHCAALVLALGTAGRTLHTFMDFEPSWMIFRVVRHLVMGAGPSVNQAVRPALESPLAWWVTTRLSLVDPVYTRREDMVPYLEHLASIDLRVFAQAVVSCDEHDAWDLLPELDRPLLVIAAENDKFTPFWCSKKIVDTVEGAELLMLADASHAALIEQPETINHRLERFFRERGLADND